MDDEVGMVAISVVILVAMAAVFFAASDVVSRDVREEPARITVDDIEIKPVSVTGKSVELDVRTRFTQMGGAAENVTVTYRATGDRSGLLETTVTRSVGSLDGEGEHTVSANLSVGRTEGVVIDVLVYDDGRRVESSSRRVLGLDTLTPDYAESDIEFQEFPNQPSIEYRIESTDGRRVRLNVSTYLTNVGDEGGSGLNLELTARQIESNIVADREQVPVGEIGTGETHRVEGSLVVPDGYNYYLDAVIWRGDVVIGSAQSVAKLDPKKTVPKNTTEEDVGLRVEDFTREKEETRRTEGGRPIPERDEGMGQPGFGIATAVLASASALYIRRKI